MKVKIIAETGKAVIVEYQDGGTQRAIVPQSVVKGDQASDADVVAGLPYGVPWQEYVSVDLAAELRRVGIWTGHDLGERPQVAAAAIQRVMGQTLAALRRAAQEYETGGPT